MAMTKEIIRWQLYRDIIRSARIFPSKNRNKIVQEIRDEFRRNRNMETIAANEQLKLAFKGLDQLNAYSNLPKKRGDWAVSLESNPMPRPQTPLHGDVILATPTIKDT